MNYSNRSEAVNHYDELCAKVYRAQAYLSALKSHPFPSYNLTRYDLEIKRCVDATQKGIERLQNQAEDVNKVINELNIEIVKI